MTAPPRATAALIIPALNEDAVIGQMLAGIPSYLYNLIVVADNGSTDRTAEIARRHGAMVVTEPERGYGAACLKAIAALPDSIGIVVFMQADASEDPHDAERLMAPLVDGRADLVLGSRTMGTADPGALLPHQEFGNAAARPSHRGIVGIDRMTSIRRWMMVSTQPP